MGYLVAKYLFMVLYKKDLIYKMFSDNIDGFKCTPIVGQLFSRCKLHNKNIQELISDKIYFFITYIAIFTITLHAWSTSPNNVKDI